MTGLSGIFKTDVPHLEVEGHHCPDCNGAGYWLTGNGLPGKLHDDLRIPCRECNGHGWIIQSWSIGGDV